MERVAGCACGRLTVTVNGDPEDVVACHCEHCLKRTGSVYPVVAWFKREVLAVELGEEFGSLLRTRFESSRLEVRTGEFETIDLPSEALDLVAAATSIQVIAITRLLHDTPGRVYYDTQERL